MASYKFAPARSGETPLDVDVLRLEREPLLLRCLEDFFCGFSID